MEQLKATISVSHSQDDKSAPFTAEGWLNCDSKDQTLELAKSFPDFVDVTTDRRYNRIFFRAYKTDPMLSMLDEFMAACAANGVEIKWTTYGFNTYYASRDEFAQHVA